MPVGGPVSVLLSILALAPDVGNMSLMGMFCVFEFAGEG